MFAPRVVKPQAKKSDVPNGGFASPRSMDEPEESLDEHVTPRDVRTVLAQDGRPLDPATLGHFQTAFGHDFGNVRVHADERAAASAASLSARAYTVGRHIVFGRSEYEPDTHAGRRLLGHELAHVVQQSRGGLAPILPGHPGLEAAADHAASQAARGVAVRVSGRSAVGIACKTLFDELSGGRYSWVLLKGALAADRPVKDLVDDVNALNAYDHRQAIDDIVQERIARNRAHVDLLKKQASAADPQLQNFLDPSLVAERRVLDRIDDVLIGVRGKGTAGTSIPGWNFTPDDFAKLQAGGKTLTMAPDSGWFPAPLQANLLKTLDLVLGPRLWPSATQGVNAMDFFHGHVVVKKAKATEPQVKAASKRAATSAADLEKARTAAVGEISYAKNKTLTADKIGAYKAVLEQAEPSLGTLMADTANIPGAAVMYHTFEFNQPRDLKAKGQARASGDPRRHYLTPLDTNIPAQYSPPAGGYEKEFTIIVTFSFLVDDTGAVHVRPQDVAGGITTVELSTITGTEFPIIEFEK